MILRYINFIFYSVLMFVVHTEQEASKKSSVVWLKTVLTSGTSADRTAALVLLIQESALHNLASLDSLMSGIRKKGGRQDVLRTLGRNFWNFLTCKRIYTCV